MMNRVLRTPMGLSVERVSSDLVVTIDLSNIAIDEWCLNLCLLKQELVDSLLFLVGKQKLKFEIGDIPESRRAHVFVSSNQVDVRVDPAELETWINFFLTYYRDGIAQVHHIDVEALRIADEPEDVYIVFTVKHARPPISAEEARKILDAYD